MRNDLANAVVDGVVERTAGVEPKQCRLASRALDDRPFVADAPRQPPEGFAPSAAVLDAAPAVRTRRDRDAEAVVGANPFRKRGLAPVGAGVGRQRARRNGDSQPERQRCSREQKPGFPCHEFTVNTFGFVNLRTLDRTTSAPASTSDRPERLPTGARIIMNR